MDKREDFNDMSLILLAGQSNMSGRGIAEVEDLTPIPGLYAFGGDLRWRPAVEPITRDRSFIGLFAADGRKIEMPDPFENLTPSLLSDGAFVRGVGPGRTFGRLFLAICPGRRVGLIPTSVGGTPISAWEPGGVDIFDAANHPYDDSVKKAREAQKYGKIAAVLWHQGEGDAARQTPDYAERLKAVIRRFRRDLGLSNVPFLLGELADFYEEPTKLGVSIVDAAMRSAAKDLPLVGIAKASGLPHCGDHLHFSAEGARRLGENYFKEYLRLTGCA